MKVWLNYLDDGTVLGHTRRCEILKRMLLKRGGAEAVRMDGGAGMNDWLSPYLPISGTFSKSPRMWGLPNDTVALRGVGVKVLVRSGKQERWMLDWVCGLGSNLWGYMRSPFCDEVRMQVLKGAGFSLPHRLEHEVAEMLCDLLGNRVPGWQPDGLGVRFCKTGSEATTMAVRLARAVTGWSPIYCFRNHYHGWLGWTNCRTPPAWGVVPKKASFVHDMPFGDFPWLNVVRKSCAAAVIMEYPLQHPPEGWLRALREACDEAGMLLILDEVVTALRYAPGGAAERYGIEPDIVCMGKALGNGLPINAVVGRREYMDWFARADPVFCSSTHWGEAVGLAAAKAVLERWDDGCVYHLWAVGAALIDGLERAGWKVVGHPPRSLLQFGSKEERAFFIHGMWEKGIMMNRPNFVSLAHTVQDSADTSAAAAEVRGEMDALGKDRVKERVKDKMPMVLFRER